jgi:uncharacterized membrane protein
MAKPTTSILKSVTTKLRINFGGLVGGLIFFCFSFTPSLLPRGYITQGVASGLSFATGYGLGVALSYFYHLLPRNRRFALSRRVKLIITSLLAAVSILFLFLGAHWQVEVRQLTQAVPTSGDYYIRVVIIAAILAFLIIWGARGARHFGRFIGSKLAKHLPKKVALYGGGILAAILLIFLINGVLFRAVFGFINYSFGLANKGTPTGIYQPHDPVFSGSPSSVIDWNSLGEKGREFVATAPTKSSIATYTGPAQAHQPSRLYVGLESAPTLDERVQLIVRELDRTEAAKRSAVLIAIPTGSGGVNAKSIQSVEYLYGGNTTSLAIQYSYLPSWLSFLADQETARQNGKVLTEAVYDWWSHLNPSARPKLLMYGESLGTLGADGAFSGPSDMHNRMNGVLLAGPPHANTLWSDIVADREAGTHQVLPIYQKGEVVRFSNGESSFVADKNQTWQQNRVGFIQHASDPVIWASVGLFVHKPDWLREPRGSDVLPNMRWYPFVTGWQVALDLPFAFGATPGHGHRYGNSLLDSWIAVLNMQLSQEKTKQLNGIIDQVKG